MDSKNKCAAITKKGNPCKNNRQRNSLFCGPHVSLSSSGEEIRDHYNSVKTENLRMAVRLTEGDEVNQRENTERELELEICQIAELIDMVTRVALSPK